MELKEIEQLVGEAETGVDRLRSLYDQYFMGIERIEPQVARKDVERRIQVLRRTQIRNTALRFRFQNILLRYNTFCAHWMRICREIEDGTYKHHLRKAKMRFDPQAQLREAHDARRKSADFEVDIDVEFGDATASEVDSVDTERPPVAAAGVGAEVGVDAKIDADLDAPDMREALRSYAVPHDVVAHSVAGRAMATMTIDPPWAAEPDPPRAFRTPRSDMPPERSTDPAPPPVPSARPSRPAPPPLPARAVRAPSGAGHATSAAAPPLPSRRSVPPPLPPTAARRQPPPDEPKAVPSPVRKRRSSRPSVAAVKPPSTAERASPRPPAQPSGLSDERVRQLYSQYVETRRSLKESTVGITVESMAKSLRDSSEKLRRKHAGKSVDFEVQVKDGKTVLKPVVK